MLNNVKSNFSFNEMNKKDLPAIYSTVFRCLLVVFLQCWNFESYLSSSKEWQRIRVEAQITS